MRGVLPIAEWLHISQWRLRGRVLQSERTRHKAILCDPLRLGDLDTVRIHCFRGGGREGRGGAEAGGGEALGGMSES